MRLLLVFFISCLFTACNIGEKQKDYAGSETSLKKEITGVWELFRIQYYPDEKPVLVDPSSKEYLEINSDGTCKDDRNSANWYISKTEDYVLDSISKVLFNEIFYVNRKSGGVFDRRIDTHQVKITKEGNVQYLYLKSLNTSITRIYIRKT